MLIRLMYVSTTQERMELDKFKELLAQSQNNNQRRDLTGMLAFNNSIFLQVLEGDREVINTLYYKLLQDPRHHKVVLMSYRCCFAKPNCQASCCCRACIGCARACCYRGCFYSTSRVKRGIFFPGF